MEYCYKKISELGRVVTGKTPPTEIEEYYGGSYPFITPSDIPSYDEKFLAGTERTISENGSRILKGTRLPANSICFVCIGSTIGKMCMTDVVSFSNQQINTLIPGKEYDSDYLFYYLRYIKSFFQLVGGGTGSGKGIVNKTLFSKTKISILEGKTNQQRIGTILSAYDNLIEVNKKRIKVLEQMAENLYKEWFVRFRFPGHETAEFENGIPKGWRICKVKEIICRLPFGKLYKTEDTEPDGKVIVIDQSTDEFVGFHNDEPSHIASPENPIVIFGDHSCKYQLMICPFSLSENVVPFIGSNGVLTAYLYYLTKGIVETTEYKRHWTEFVAKKVLAAPLDLQEQFAKQIIPIQKAIQSEAKKNRNLIKQRDLLLPRLMSGKLEV